jgi:hypothetical protein
MNNEKRQLSEELGIKNKIDQVFTFKDFDSKQFV